MPNYHVTFTSVTITDSSSSSSINQLSESYDKKYKNQHCSKQNRI